MKRAINNDKVIILIYAGRYEFVISSGGRGDAFVASTSNPTKPFRVESVNQYREIIDVSYIPLLN